MIHSQHRCRSDVAAEVSRQHLPSSNPHFLASHTGDKEASFVGSSQWIGALELSFVLDTLLGVTCRVLDVAAGSDLPSKARELAHHFDTQGAQTRP